MLDGLTKSASLDAPPVIKKLTGSNSSGQAEPNSSTTKSNERDPQVLKEELIVKFLDVTGGKPFTHPMQCRSLLRSCNIPFKKSDEKSVCDFEGSSIELDEFLVIARAYAKFGDGD